MNNNNNVKYGVRVWLFNPNGQVLMGLRLSKHGFNMWSVPGGKPDKNESLMDAAIRETWEETGIPVSHRMLEFIGKTEDVADGLCFINTHYRVNNITMMPSVAEKDSCAGWRWFDMHNLPTPLFWPVQNFIKQKVFGV